MRKHRELMICYIKHGKPYLVTKFRNDGILAASYDLILLIDDDNVVDRNCTRILAETMIRYENVGVAEPVTYYLRKPDTIQYAGTIYGKFTRQTISSITILKIMEA